MAVQSLPSGSFCWTFLLCIFCLSSISAKQCIRIDTCSCKMDDGSGTISLHDVDNKDGTARFKNIQDKTSATYTFSWNPCTPLKSTNACEGNNGCQYTPDPYPVGKPETTFSVNGDGTILLSYQKVTTTSATADKYTRQLKITLKCAKVEPGSIDGISETTGDSESTYTGTFTSKYSCKYIQPSSSGLSIGSILLIVFFPLLVMYFVLGIVINKYARHKEGSDVIPNRSFWSDFPFLVKDGWVFSCGKVKGCCSSLFNKVKGDGSYTKI